MTMTLLAILADAAVKGVVLLVLATVLAAVLRRSSAAARHLVWSAALAVLVALPVLSASCDRRASGRTLPCR